MSKAIRAGSLELEEQFSRTLNLIGFDIPCPASLSSSAQVRGRATSYQNSIR